MDILQELHEKNSIRAVEWETGAAEPFDLAFFTIEFAGEAGELCNKIKKRERERRGARGSRTNEQEIKAEMADVIICLDSISRLLGFGPLTPLIAPKFNETSDKNGLSTMMDEGVRRKASDYLDPRHDAGRFVMITGEEAAVRDRLGLPNHWAEGIGFHHFPDRDAARAKKQEEEDGSSRTWGASLD